MIENLLRSRYAAKIVFAALIGAAIMIVIARFFVLPRVATSADPGPYAETWANVISYVTDAGLEACFATLIIAVLFLALIPEEVRLGRVETVYPKDVGNGLLRALAGTDEYYFRGRSARWFRSKVLPELAKEAKQTSTTKRLYLLLPDPSSLVLMQNYADYRNSISYPGKRSPWTSWDVQREILATMVSVGHAMNSNVLVYAEVGLLDSYSLMRVDMVTESAMLTREDPKLPAIRCARGSTLYDSTREEILQGIAQGRALPLPVQGARGRGLDNAFVRDVLDSLSLQAISMDATKVDDVLKASLNPENPYR